MYIIPVIKIRVHLSLLLIHHRLSALCSPLSEKGHLEKAATRARITEARRASRRRGHQQWRPSHRRRRRPTSGACRRCRQNEERRGPARTYRKKCSSSGAWHCHAPTVIRLLKARTQTCVCMPSSKMMSNADRRTRLRIHRRPAVSKKREWQLLPGRGSPHNDCDSALLPRVAGCDGARYDGPADGLVPEEARLPAARSAVEAQGWPSLDRKSVV